MWQEGFEILPPPTDMLAAREVWWVFPVGWGLEAQLQPLVQDMPAAPATSPTAHPESALSVSGRMWKISTCAMVLPTYAAICPVPAVKQAYFCRAAENMTLNYCLQQGVGLSSRWEKQPCCSQGWHIGRLNSSQQSCSESQFVPSPKVIVLFFKFMEEFIPCTLVIGSFLALCMKR